MKNLILGGLLAALHVATAFAQTGPVDARFLGTAARRVTPPIPDGLWAEVEIRVLANGRSGGVKITTSSGQQKFDDRAVSAFADARFTPAVDASGAVRDDGVVRLRYGLRAVVPVDAQTAEETASKSKQGRNASANTEAARIRRMACKDFLWEYGFMRTASKEAHDELMPGTALAMSVVDLKIEDDRSKYRLARDWPGIFKSAVKSCEAQPEALFYDTVLRPSIEARLKR
jgi:TonB family protein